MATTEESRIQTETSDLMVEMRSHIVNLDGQLSGAHASNQVLEEQIWIAGSENGKLTRDVANLRAEVERMRSFESDNSELRDTVRTLQGHLKEAASTIHGSKISMQSLQNVQGDLEHKNQACQQLEIKLQREQQAHQQLKIELQDERQAHEQLKIELQDERQAHERLKIEEEQHINEPNIEENDSYRDHEYGTAQCAYCMHFKIIGSSGDNYEAKINKIKFKINMRCQQTAWDTLHLAFNERKLMLGHICLVLMRYIWGLRSIKCWIPLSPPTLLEGFLEQIQKEGS